MLIVGLMSGTSLDGIDAALVEIGGDRPESVSWRVVHSSSAPYSTERRDAVHAAILDGSADALCALHADIGEWLAEGAIRVCEEAGVPLARVAAIGSHGQRVKQRADAL
ncbi:MAG TPA: anhydro-N-acetylmuramic acid kinase, partial [Longimicrobiaceae bacterium]|nr:anhydro-N-acetylmuramic acid kinase [Longimicrobiaceae bacterium]